jgi:hypothetical protein
LLAAAAPTEGDAGRAQWLRVAERLVGNFGVARFNEGREARKDLSHQTASSAPSYQCLMEHLQAGPDGVAISPGGRES